MKKLIALLLVCIMALSVGLLAYFSDREIANDGDPWAIQIDDKGIDIRPVDPDNPVDPVDPDPNPGETIQDIWDMNNEGNVENKDVYPGEKVDLGFDLVNGSDNAVDIRETIVLTVSDYAGKSIKLKDILGDSEYEMWKDSEKDTYGAIDGKTSLLDLATSINRDGENTIVYKLKPFTIDGKNENITGKGTRAHLAYELIMDKLALNEFQASECQVDYIIEAKQHAEGGADKGWTEVENITLNIGGNNYGSFVPTVDEQQ